MRFLHSSVVSPLLEVVAQKDFNPGALREIPLDGSLLSSKTVATAVNRLVQLARQNWDAFEQSWDFSGHPIASFPSTRLSESWAAWRDANANDAAHAKQLEDEVDRACIEAYGLQAELSADVPEEQITLVRADRERDSQRLVSYAVGCMMGRYSIDEPGLIYALAGNTRFRVERYAKFPADSDGIVPVTDTFWFDDDAAKRVREFLRALWTAETLDENMGWLAASLGIKGAETPDDALRRYLSDKFFKDHLQIYKKRPSTGSSRAARKRRSSALSTYTATTSRHSPACVPTTSSRCTESSLRAPILLRTKKSRQRRRRRSASSRRDSWTSRRRS